MSRRIAQGFKLAALALVLILWVGVASAAPKTITVCLSGCDYSSIQTAIDAASPGDEIEIRKGKYVENLTIEKDIYLQGAGRLETKIEGSATADPSKPVIYIQSDQKIEVEIHSLYVAGGRKCLGEGYMATCPDGIEIHGKASANIANCRINFNYGKGIAVFDSAEVRIWHSSIEHHTLSGVSLLDSASAAILYSDFSDNGGIGAIELWDSAKAAIQDSTISDNAFGGVCVTDKAELTIRDSEILENGFSGTDAATGGGIYVWTPAQIIIKNNTISKNNHEGIAIGSSAMAVIQNNTIYGNGGNGINLYEGVQAEIQDSRIINNEGYGVALYLPDCGFTDSEYFFAGEVQGSGNEIPDKDEPNGNNRGTLCPEDYDWPSDFIKTNQPPQAHFTYSPPQPTDLDTIQFTDKSSDPDGELVEWHWDFGDGSTSTEQNPSYRYQDDGRYTVKLTVTDDDGATDSTGQTITVSNVPPTAGFTFSPTQPLVNQPVTFDASASSDPDGTIDRYEWDFRDGTTAEGIRAAHAFSEEGSYKVRLIVTDDDGDSDSVEKEVTIVQPEPKIEEKYAIVIGISDYEYATDQTCPGFCDLKYPAQDAQAFYDLLVDPSIGNLPKEDVTLLLNEGATNEAFRGAFGRLITLAEEDDLVVIYYSGHGGQGSDLDGDEGDGMDEYYIAYDTKVDDLFGTAIRDDEFGNWMSALRSQHVVVFLDSCFSGGATREVRSLNPPGFKANPNNSVFNDFSLENRVLIAASQENQPSFESDELGKGVFTYFLLEALGGNADADRNGKIVADEVYQYVRPKVKEYVAKHWPGYVQTPLKKGTISPAIICGEGKALEGIITAIIGGKEWAELEDEVLISLGQSDGVKIGDIFEVYHEYVTKGVIVEERRGKIQVEDFVGEDRSLCRVIESLVPLQAGDKVRRIQG